AAGAGAADLTADRHAVIERKQHGLQRVGRRLPDRGGERRRRGPGGGDPRRAARTSRARRADRTSRTRRTGRHDRGQDGGEGGGDPGPPRSSATGHEHLRPGKLRGRKAYRPLSRPGPLRQRCPEGAGRTTQSAERSDHTVGGTVGSQSWRNARISSAYARLLISESTAAKSNPCGAPGTRWNSTGTPDRVIRETYSMSSSRKMSRSPTITYAGGRPARLSARAGAAYGDTASPPRRSPSRASHPVMLSS